MRLFPFVLTQAGDGQGGLSAAIAIDGSVEVIVALPMFAGKQLTWDWISTRAAINEMAVVDLGNGQQVFSGTVTVLIEPSPNIREATKVRVRAYVGTTIPAKPGY